MGYQLTPEQFLDVVFKTIKDTVAEQGQQHPEDIMTTVTLATETIYQFVANTPSEIWFKNE